MEKKQGKSGWSPGFRTRLKVKLTSIFLLLTLFQLQAAAVAQRTLTLNLENVSVESAIGQIQQNSDYRFIFNTSDIDLVRKITLHVKDKPIDFVLGRLFGGTSVSYKISDTQVILKRENIQNLSANVLPFPISGRVVDENGLPLPGATVMEEKTKKTTMTDLEGNFQLDVENPEATVVIVYVGYEQLRFQASQVPNPIKLTPEINALSEVVVIGYGTSKRKDVSGAVASIQEKDMNKGAITNPLQLIAGKMAGVAVTQTGSEPGAAPNIRIRGISSLSGGNDPLVVVDGIQGNLEFLNSIPPGEIASMDILKDASATAVYGSRGAPGVIIVTTKKGKSGATSVEFTSMVSFDQIANKLKMLNADQWWEEAQRTGVPASANHGANTDWFDVMTKSGVTQNYGLSFGGGSENFNYRASINAILQDGIVRNSSNNKYIGTVQATQKALDGKLRLNFNLNSGITYNNSMVQSIGRVGFTSNLISQAYVMRPTDPVLNEDGSYFTDPNVFQYLNPYAVSESVVSEGQYDNLFGSFRADLDLFEGLTAGWFGSWRKTSSMEGFFLPASSTDANAINQKGFANIWNRRQNERLMNISLTYAKQFGKHNLNILGLYEWQNQMYQGSYAAARGFINDITAYHALQLGDISKVLPNDVQSYKNDRTLISFLGRLNYGFDDKYLLTASLRRDGSTVFGANHKWGNFMAASAAWQVHKEAFLEDVSWINEFKIRGGYGETGNQQGLNPQNSISRVEAAGVVYFGELTTNFGISQNANADLKWEVKKQTNVGFDFSLFDSRLRGSFDIFRSRTDDLLFNYTVPQPPYPFGSIMANVGSLENKGIEAALAYDVIRNDDLRVTLAGNVSFIKNKVLKLSGSINGVPLNTDFVGWGPSAFLIEGQPIGTFNILQHTGKDQNDAETVRDVDGNGIIDQGARSPDRAISGQVLPKYTFAFNPTMQYKNFDFSMLWRGSGGNKIYNGLRATLSYQENIGKANVLESSLDDRIFTSQYASDKWLEDGSFIRLENMTFGYNMPLQYKYLESVRLTLVANNLLLFTKYTGIDPELNFSGGSGAGGDNGIYPRTRTIAVGLNFKIK